MKNCIKISMKASNGITLIALVITIIVLLILAGISISMLSGDNGILQQTTTARTRTTHANVLEQMQLEASAYTVDKTTGTYSNSLIDYLKSKSIISDISGEEDKWLINVTTLLGSNQSMGKGTYPNDVYVLEKHDTSTGSIVNTKVATTTPIKIAATSTTQITYKVVYYENDTSENLILGSITDSNNSSSSPPIVSTDESNKLYEYFKDKSAMDIMSGQVIDGISTNFLYADGTDGFIEYKNNIYIVALDPNDYSVSSISLSNDSAVDTTQFGEVELPGGDKILVTPIIGDNTVLIHTSYTTGQFLDENGNEFEGYCAHDLDGYDRYYNTLGVLVPVQNIN